MYSPLKHFKVNPGQRSSRRLGGLGHMAIKLAVAMGAEVTVSAHPKQRAGRAPAQRMNLSFNTPEESRRFGRSVRFHP
jgi:D-arabinose 1-dehydrogenase-like Zn-dependent alcohol dehydrogenase